MSAITTQTESSNLPRTVLYSSSLKGKRGAVAEDSRATNTRKDSLVTVGERKISDKDISILVEQLPVALPSHQDVLLLFGPRQSYTLTSDWPIPTPQLPGELVVKVRAIGLNPFDWKSADYNFGIPELPYLAGRDFAGIVVKAPTGASNVKEGDLVIGTSTDYRDMRKAAFQEYAIANSHNISRLPSTISLAQGASLGVAYVAAVIALGVCLGLDYSRATGKSQGTDLWKLIQDLPSGNLPPDVVNECLNGIVDSERPRQGEWLAIWGGSSTSALFLSQLAQLAGMRVVLVVDLAKHAVKLINRGGSVLVDGHDPERAVKVIRALTGNSLRFAIDTVGKETAQSLLDALSTPLESSDLKSHIVGLSGLPKAQREGVVSHSVPIKIFHEVDIIGSTMMAWLEDLLDGGLVLPEIALAEGGLGGVNAALDRMRRGEISGRRLVVPLD